MIVILLDKLLELKTKMQGRAHDDLDETAALLCRLTGCGVYLLGWRGVVEGYAPQMQGDECSLVQMLVESGARLPRKMLKRDDPDRGGSFWRNDEHPCPFKENQPCLHPERRTALIPLFMNGERVGTIVLVREDRDFTEEDILLAEYAGAMAGYRLAIAKKIKRGEMATKKSLAQQGLARLSYTEWEGIAVLMNALRGLEGTLVVSMVARQAGISRNAILSALRKLEMTELIQTDSLGRKGLHISIKNEFLLEEIRRRIGKATTD